MIKNLTLTKKIALSNILYIIPICLTLMLLFNVYNKDINFAQKERSGLKLEEKAILLLSKVISNSLSDPEAVKTANEILQIKSTYSDELLLTNSDLKNKNKLDLSNAEFNKLLQSNLNSDLTKLALEINSLITYVGNSSNLILDPDLDTYFVMDSAIYGVPQILNRLDELQRLILKLAGSTSKISTTDQIHLNVLLEFLKINDFPRIHDDIETALKEDQNFNLENILLQKDVSQSFKDFEKSFNTYFERVRKIANGENINKEAVESDFKNLNSELIKFQNFSTKALDEMLNSRIESIQSTRMKTSLLAILILITAVVVSIYIVNDAKRSLRNICLRLKSSNNEVDELAQTSKKLSENVSGAVHLQVAATHQMTTTSENMVKVSSLTTENVNTSILTSDQTVTAISNSNILMKELFEAMTAVKEVNQKISDQSQLNSKNFESIIEIISQIDDKTKMINEIVFQTKLLSFNASVEAARAGEAGKGFSVVAEEVGNLSQMSGQAAFQISTLLNESLDKVKSLSEEANKAINSIIHSSSINVEHAIVKVHSCLETNSELINKSEKLHQVAQNVKDSTTEQSRGLFEIAEAISRFDEISSKNTTIANELNHSANLLNKKSNELTSIVEELSILSGVN